jgi:hypothetical protein
MIIFISIFIPAVAFADVRVTEIAWMGTSESQYGEWIELYNDGSNTVDLAGWKIYADGGNQVLFTLTSSISANGYLLIERTTASMPDPVPGITDESGVFGGGGLSNVGEYLLLKDANSNTVQSIDYTSGWPAGNSTTKETMQWDGSAWITAVGTPKQSLVAEEEEEEEITEEAEEKSSSPTKKQKAVDPHVLIDMPEAVFRGVPSEYRASVALVDATQGPLQWVDGLYVWNMGDGTIIKTQGNAPHAYAYRYPGTYTVAVAYYKKESDTIPLLKYAETVKIQIPDIQLELLEEGKALQIKNGMDKPVDLSGWKVRNGTVVSLIPDMTILAPRATIAISAETLHINIYEKSELIAPDGMVVGKL